MKFARKIKERITGKYKRRERKYTPVARELILAGLERGDFADPGMAGYLEQWLPYLANQKKAGDLTFFVGSKMARRLLRLSKDEVEPPPVVFYEKLKAWYDREAGVFDFDGLRFVPAVNASDAEIFASVFCDVLLAHLLGDGCEDIVRGISLEGDYERGEVRVAQGDVVVDCGANMGMFSALASRKGGRVLAFEPSRGIRETYLDRNAALNGDITVCPYALSDRKETLEFFSDHHNIGSSARADAVAVQGNAAGHMETVDAVSLDEYVSENGIERIDFIKADIEGSERLMLRGAGEVLRRFAPKLSICTYHLPDDPRVLKDIILGSNPEYTIVQEECKLYAHVGR